MALEDDGAAADAASEVDTDRSGADELLESMFTERTAENDDDECDDSDLEELPADTESPTDCSSDHRESDERSDCHRESGDLNDEDERVDGDDQCPEVETSSRAATPAHADHGQTTDSIERRGGADAADPPPPEHSALRVIAFDVGGKLFRCKESLIRKHPRKRLHQVISCGCERLGHDTFFIDRNPQNFEVVLDWYRTGLYVRHPHVDEVALQEDAKYFDLYAELFPDKILPAQGVDRTAAAVLPGNSSDAAHPQQQTPPRVPPRPHRHPQQSLVAGVPSSQLSGSPTTDRVSATNAQVSGTHDSPTRSVGRSAGCGASSDDAAKSVLDTGALQYCRTERRSVVADSVPVVYMMRENERLLVASVAGHGRLLVRVCDATGMQAVFVDSAVLFDSQSWFYLQGGRAKLEHCFLPGNHTYTFWMEPSAQTTSDSNSTESFARNRSAASKHSAHPVNEKPELEVEFRIVSSFRADEQCPDSLDDELRSLAGNASVVEVFPSSAKRGSASSTTFSPFMFLPPQLQQRHEANEQVPDQHPERAPPCAHDSKLTSPQVASPNGLDVDPTKQMKDRDTVARQLFGPPASGQHKTTLAASAVDKAAKKVNVAGSMQPSAIKRGGAAVVAGSASAKVSSNNNNCSNSSSNSKINTNGAPHAGRVTVYRAAQLKIDDSPRGDDIFERTLETWV